VTDTAVPALITSRDVVRALLTGEQIVDLRPGGGRESRPSGTRFWLYPAPGEGPELKPAYRLARDLSVPEEEPPAGQVRIDGWAELVATATTRLDPERVAALDSKTVLALDRLAGTAGADPSGGTPSAGLGDHGGDLLVLVLRAHRLLEPLTVPTDLTGLAGDPADTPSEPALSDVAFEARLKGVEGALPGGLTKA
jgi:Domain of unknown function (DUF1802)